MQVFCVLALFYSIGYTKDGRKSAFLKHSLDFIQDGENDAVEGNQRLL